MKIQWRSIMQRRGVILTEFVLMAIVLPSVIIYWRLAPYMFLFLWGTLAYCVLVWQLLPREAQGATGMHALWRWEAVNRTTMRPMLIRFAISCVLMLAFISIYDPDRRFALLGERPEVWAMVMLLYPLLSALPQEFIFCNYFFRRFQPLFRREEHLVAASAVVFAYAHVLFINPVAPLLSLIGGYFFASTYAKHRSLALVTIEHALYGNALFTLGLGWYFWGGALR